MVKLLLDNKSPLNATDISGYTALHHAVSEGHGDTALTLLKAGAETDKKDVDGFLAIELAPDTKVDNMDLRSQRLNVSNCVPQIRKFITQNAEREGIDLL